eukprot:2554223-Pleurochrysis_carterae.AAC.6
MCDALRAATSVNVFSVSFEAILHAHKGAAKPAVVLETFNTGWLGAPSARLGRRRGREAAGAHSSNCVPMPRSARSVLRVIADGASRGWTR